MSLITSLTFDVKSCENKNEHVLTYNSLLSLTGLILGGDFFVASVVLNTMVKLILKLQGQVEAPIYNKIVADVSNSFSLFKDKLQHLEMASIYTFFYRIYQRTHDSPKLHKHISLLISSPRHFSLAHLPSALGKAGLLAKVSTQTAMTALSCPCVFSLRRTSNQSINRHSHSLYISEAHIIRAIV